MFEAALNVKIQIVKQAQYHIYHWITLRKRCQLFCDECKGKNLGNDESLMDWPANEFVSRVCGCVRHQTAPLWPTAEFCKALRSQAGLNNSSALIRTEEQTSACHSSPISVAIICQYLLNCVKLKHLFLTAPCSWRGPVLRRALMGWSQPHFWEAAICKPILSKICCLKMKGFLNVAWEGRFVPLVWKGSRTENMSIQSAHSDREQLIPLTHRQQ